MAKRVILFLLTNLAITLVLGIVLNIIFNATGIQGQSIAGILVLSLVFGFSGSLISLFLSKSMALRSVGAEVITQPRNEAEQWLCSTSSTTSEYSDARYCDLPFLRCKRIRNRCDKKELISCSQYWLA